MPICLGGEFDAKLVIGVGKGTSSAQLISSNGVEKLAEAQLGHDSVSAIASSPFIFLTHRCGLLILLL